MRQPPVKVGRREPSRRSGAPETLQQPHSPGKDVLPCNADELPRSRGRGSKQPPAVHGKNARKASADNEGYDHGHTNAGANAVQDASQTPATEVSEVAIAVSSIRAATAVTPASKQRRQARLADPTNTAAGVAMSGGAAMRTRRSTAALESSSSVAGLSGRDGISGSEALLAKGPAGGAATAPAAATAVAPSGTPDVAFQHQPAPGVLRSQGPPGDGVDSRQHAIPVKAPRDSQPRVSAPAAATDVPGGGGAPPAAVSPGPGGVRSTIHSHEPAGQTRSNLQQGRCNSSGGLRSSPSASSRDGLGLGGNISSGTRPEWAIAGPAITAGVETAKDGGPISSGEERLLALRRAAVMGQWNQFLGKSAAAPVPTPGRPQASPAQRPAAAPGPGVTAEGMQPQAGSHSSAAPQTFPAAAPTAAVITTATPPASASAGSATGASPDVAALPASPAAAPIQGAGEVANGSGAAALSAARTAAAPLRGRTSSAAGAAVIGTSAAADPAQPPPAPVGRVAAALLPLTIQGRISRLEAASQAAHQARNALRQERRAVVGTALPEPATAARAPKQVLASEGATTQDTGRNAPGRTTTGSVPESPAADARLQTSDYAPPSGLATSAPPLSFSAPNASDAASAATTGRSVAPAAPAAAAPTAEQATTSQASAAHVQRRTQGSVPVEAVDVAEQAKEASAAHTPPAADSASILAGNASHTSASSPRPLADQETSTSSLLPPEVAAAKELFHKLSRYRPMGREDGPATLAPHARYQRPVYQAAATAAARHPSLLLTPLSLPHLSYIASAYAAAGHVHQPFLRTMASTAYDKLAKPSAPPSPDVAAAAGTAAAAAPLTFRSASMFLVALARLASTSDAGGGNGGGGGGAFPRLVAALGRWLARELHSGAVTPRAKWKGTWLAVALWAYACLQRTLSDAACGGGGEAAAAPAPPLAAQRLPPPPGGAVAAAGAAFFTEAAEAIRVAPGWLHLMDCREALWSLWALRVAAEAYNSGGADAVTGAAGGSASAPRVFTVMLGSVQYEPNPLVELKLAARAASQFDQLDPGQLAEAYAVAAEARLGADAEVLAALRRCTLARAAAARPQPLAVMVAALAVMQVRDVVWLSALAAACRNQMINMAPDQIVVVLHGLAVALGFYYMPLFHAAAVVCTVPGMERLGGMGPGEVVRLAGAFAAAGHYEGILLRRAAEHMLTLGSEATAWQRASVLHYIARLSHRNNPLLRAVAAETFSLPAPGATATLTPAPGTAAASPSSRAGGGVPPALLAMVAAACGQLQFRPPGLLPALHAARRVAWRRLSMAQRAAVCWAALVLSGGLAGGSGADAGGCEGSSEAERQHSCSEAGAEGSPTLQGLQGRAQQRKQQHEELLAALREYLRDLASTDAKQWPPPTDAHHAQLLVACSVLARPTGAPATVAMGTAVDDGLAGGRASLGGAIAGALSLRPRAAGALRGALLRLPAGALRRVLVMQTRGRQAALGPWSQQVAELLRIVLAELTADAQAVASAAAAAAADAGDGAAAELPCAGGRSQLWRGVRLVSGSVAEGLVLCDGALGVDVALELEVDVEVASVSAEDLVVSLAPQGADAGLTRHGDGPGSVSAPAHRLYRQRIRLALDLCALQPPGGGVAGGGAAAALSGIVGSGVVRNSHWLLPGGAALRRRLLTRLGWQVVPLRERTWREWRSPQQQRRGIEELLRRVRWRRGMQDTADGSGEDGVVSRCRIGSTRVTPSTRSGRSVRLSMAAWRSTRARQGLTAFYII